MTQCASEAATASDLPPSVYERLCAIARVPVLLVASDYDGTIAPIVDDPSAARPRRESMVALRSLAAMHSTHAAIISGRALSDLAALTRDPENIHLVGSHGSEFDAGFTKSLDAQQVELRERIETELRAIAQRTPGAHVELKPASVALHVRRADAADGERAVRQAEEGPAALPGVHTKHGKAVIELAVLRTSKAGALTTLRQHLSATAVVFFGDDVTDEDAFATLGGPDMAIKVGEGDSVAPLRVASTLDVARALAVLCEQRAAWLEGSQAPPIEHHAMLTDQRTIALVAPGARVSWLCLPRIDSPALFAELLGGESAGYFEVAPSSGGEPDAVEYAGDTFTLQTRWPSVRVTDYLDCSGGRPVQRAGRSDLIRVIEGSGRVRITFAPRLDFGRERTRLMIRESGVAVQDSFDPIVLSSPGVSWTLREDGLHHTAVAEVELRAGEPIVLELRYGTGRLAPSIVSESDRRRQTDAFWSSWVGMLDIPTIASDLCRRSALVLRGLVQGPTGAIAAAGTTSLPEWIGGVRNWDYRYCWPRDASMAASTLVDLGSTHEAVRLLDWLLGVIDTLPAPDRLAPIYTVAGGNLPPEAEITELSGYAGSRPVRIGNAASRQLQLDVFGPIIELVWALVRRGAPLSSVHWRLVQHMVEAIRSRWREPDHGIWEVRGPAKHFVHSKVMCWDAVRLGCDISREFLDEARPEWERLRDEIADEILELGWSREHNSFMTAYGDDAVDAATLAVGLCGLVEPDDARFRSTVERIEHELRGGPTVWRYRMDDGLPGSEGGFTLCTSWLIEAMTLVGRLGDAEALFEDLCACAGQTGLMPEELDPQSRRGLGNHPQAYSHLGLIRAARAIERAHAAPPA